MWCSILLHICLKEKKLRCTSKTKIRYSLTIKIIYRIKEEVGHQNPVHNRGSQKNDEGKNLSNLFCWPPN